jgi:hypothetical protein
MSNLNASTFVSNQALPLSHKSKTIVKPVRAGKTMEIDAGEKVKRRGRGRKQLLLESFNKTDPITELKKKIAEQ